MKKTRTSTAAPLPEKSMVDYASRYNAVADFFALEDAYAQERSGLDFFRQLAMRKSRSFF